MSDLRLPSGLRGILLDIEGTTTDIHFVHRVLFPYATEHLPGFLAEHPDDPEVQACLQAVADTVTAETGSTPDRVGCLLTLLDWIRTDRKHPALKTLQGLVWRHGYESGAYVAHVYPDVPPALNRWRAAGLDLAIYSSGSVAAQHLLFAHTVAGDLRPLFSAYFDTRVGAKTEPASYAEIARQWGYPSEQVLFLSDHPGEVAAARSAGMQAWPVCRSPAEPTAATEPVVVTFETLDWPASG